MQSYKEVFFEIVRAGIGHYGTVLSGSVDWNKIYGLAIKQGLLAVVVDGIERFPNAKRPPQELLLEWIGEILQSYEFLYDAYKKTIAEMAGFYNSHGYKMMVLKGYACSLNWPKPEHRPCGDIDIWQFGQQKEADALISKEKGIEVDYSHLHHTVFNWGEFTVENHYDFINTQRHYSHQGLEQIFKELGQDDSHYVEVKGEKVYLPSPNLHALFLIRHALNHFASIGINLRQVLDWAFFAEKHTNEIDWVWLVGVINQYHMKDFFDCINAICVEDLGFQPSIFPYVQFNPSLKEKVLADVFAPKYTREEPNNLIPRLFFKFRRWKGNAWKHEMCYKESLMSGFWSGVWNHLLKPSSI